MELTNLPILEQLEDGRIRYRSQDGEVTGWQVGMYAVRDAPKTARCDLRCYRCNETYITDGTPCYTVDDLERERRAILTLTKAAAHMYADEVSRSSDSIPRSEWVCTQMKRDTAGLPWQSIRQWREEKES